MPRNLNLATLILLVLVVLPTLAQDIPPAGAVAWCKDLTTGMADAKKTERVLMICINAKFVDGRKDEERAAKGLREVVYKDPRVVAKSREFSCVLMTPNSGVIDHGLLRGLGIDGEIVSPQHIFVNSAGDRIVLRRQYWRHGKGEAAVKALLDLMALAQVNAARPVEAPAPEAEAAPEDAEARAKWIAERLAEIEAEDGKRDVAIRALVEADREGDCTGPLIALLPKHKRDTEILWSLIRGLGRDGLEVAALPISKFLGHRDPSIRANAAVSLEYIGSQDKKVVGALLKVVTRQKDESVANHMYRALGRCGAKQARVRTLLLKMAASGKSEFATYGPSIGLAYFEGDAKAARGVEKLLLLIGIPGSRRGGGQNTVKRGLVSWTLASIGDPKSGPFVREELIEKLRNVKAFWVKGMVDFWTAVAEKCEGDETKMAGIEAGVGVSVGFARRGALARYGAETRSLMDGARMDRDTSEFKPRGDGLLDVDEGEGPPGRGR